MTNAKYIDRAGAVLFLARAGVTCGCCVISSCCMLSGCAVTAPPSPLPQYQLVSGEESLRIIADRQASILSVSAQCEIVLTGPDEQRIKLDGVLLAAPQTTNGPQVRLRGWKLGQAVFDLTLTDGSAWLMTPEDPRAPQPAQPAVAALSGPPPVSVTHPARRIAEAFDFLGPAYFRTATVSQITPTLLVASPAPSRLDQATCQIARQTLTPASFTAVDPRGTSELSLQDYRFLAGIPWPHQLGLSGPDGTIQVTMSEVELNGELPPTAFVPPARARRLP